MKRYRIAAIVLGVLTGLLLLLTRFGSFGLRSDTVVVDLGFQASQSARAQELDRVLLDVLERGQLSAELRRRLDKPAQSARINSLWADRYEVQQNDFESFAKWRQRLGGLQDAGALYSSSSGHRIAGLLEAPASGVNFAGASAYCQAAGGRLPWAEEWEALAVGKQGRLYPWGDTFEPRFWPYQDAYRNASQPPGTHPDAATPEGAHDLVNNVMEWSRGRRDANALKLKPGAHGAPAIRASGRALYALSAAWLEIKPETRSHHLGFRCVYEYPPLPTLWSTEPQVVELAGGEYPLGIPADLRLARVAVLLPPAQQRNARQLVEQKQARRLEVGRCEVSRKQYNSFLQHPLARLGLFANEHEPRWLDYTPQNWEAQLKQLDLPLSGVSWWAADAFARWAGGRLPSVEEWQLLAAGVEANSYPWGDDYEAGAAATGDQPEPGARSCGTAPRDNSNGIHDLGGNVSEWTRSVTTDRGNYAAWVQGGNWLLPGKTTARTVFGRPVPLTHRSPSIGFRVVYD